MVVPTQEDIRKARKIFPPVAAFAIGSILATAFLSAGARSATVCILLAGVVAYGLHLKHQERIEVFPEEPPSTPDVHRKKPRT